NTSVSCCICARFSADEPAGSGDCALSACGPRNCSSARSEALPPERYVETFTTRVTFYELCAYQRQRVCCTRQVLLLRLCSHAARTTEAFSIFPESNKGTQPRAPSNMAHLDNAVVCSR